MSRSDSNAIKHIVQSPMTVVAVAALSTLLWSAVYGATAPAAADVPEPVNERAEVATLADPSAGDPRATPPRERPALPVEVPPRQGPRLLAPPDPDVPGYDIALEDRDGHSMDRLHDALRRAERGEGQARLVFYGASHVASDLITGSIREELQARFGDAGHGLVLPAHPWPSYRHRGVDVESNRGRWSSTKVRAGDRDVDHYGVAGTFVETDRAGAFGRVSTETRGDIGRSASLFDLYYMGQPGGGSFDILIDGHTTERVRTDAASRESGYATFRVPDAPHSFEVRAVGDGPIRLFGLAVERETPGVIVDTLGINGARARYHLMWDDTLYREHLRRRQPDLVVLAYGTNESGDELAIARYEEQLRTVLTRVRDTAPRAACLLIGPSDRPIRENGTFLDRPRTAQLVESQYRIALENGCAFFDLVALSGGPLSMVDWVANDPSYGGGDYVHYTRRGYQRVADVLLRALMDGYVPAN